MHASDRKPKVYLYGRNRVAHIVILLVSFRVQIAKRRVLENFQGLKVRGRGQGLLNWSSRILEDEDFPRGQQLCLKVLRSSANLQLLYDSECQEAPTLKAFADGRCYSQRRYGEQQFVRRSQCACRWGLVNEVRYVYKPK